MGTTKYLWRKLTPKQRDELMAWRKRFDLPWHRPPHRASEKTRYHITAACFEHASIIGHHRQRMECFCAALLTVLQNSGGTVHAWCVLPNHYHALVQTSGILTMLKDLGQMHGRLSHEWNGEDKKRGRQVWCGVAERYMRNDAHFWATLNYVHNNPVHHGYVQRWQEWPFSSAHEFLSEMGRTEAERLWRQYPVREYGRGWDDPEL